MEQDKIFKEAHKVEAKFCADDENWFAYLRREKYLHDEASRIPYIKAKAEKRGEKRGMEIGEKSGRLMEKFENAKNLLKAKVDVSTIKQALKLTDDELNAILTESGTADAKSAVVDG